MKTLFAFILVGSAVAFLVNCTPSNPGYRYDSKIFAQPKLDDAYVTPQPRKSLNDKRVYRR